MSDGCGRYGGIDDSLLFFFLLLVVLFCQCGCFRYNY
ncbi:MAG: sporulation protein YjcZ [Clostridia bacterium]|nr:sporulation protein YjcZ [Clostridia bacterium]